PRPLNDPLTVAEDTDAATAVDVLGNDLSDDNPSRSIRDFDATSVHGGQVELQEGTGPDGRDHLAYIPPANFFGRDTFTYELTDSTGTASRRGTVIVPATEENDPPLAVADSGVGLSTNEDESLTLPFARLLDN